MLEWALYMVLINPVGEFHKNYKLQTYDNAEECHKEEARIGNEMKLSYPGDTSFRIVCKDPDSPTKSVIPEPSAPPTKPAI